MELKIKFLKWSAGIPVAMLNKKTADKIGVNTNERISIKTLTKPERDVSIIVDTVKGFIKKDEIGVSSETKKIIKLRVGQKVEVNLTPAPKSLAFIKKKLNKKTLTEKEIDEIIEDIVNNSLSEAEIALFISGMYKHGMNMKETINLTKAILKTGKVLKLRNKKKFIADKHSIGGIPGNRTTPIVVSICAASGLIMPKSSSRAITSSAGTADVIETLASVEFSIKEVKKIIRKTNACMIWGGSLGIVPADSKIVHVEKIVNIDPQSQLLASIMAKKLAMGAEYILIDIPYGKTAKVNRNEAGKLKKKFEYLGKFFKKKLKVILNESEEPLGVGVGPALEMIDVIRVLDPEKQGPKNLEKKSLLLAALLLEMTGKAKKNKGIKLAEKILYSGKAFEKFKQIITAQKGIVDKIKNLKPAKFKKEIFSRKSGIVSEISNNKINSLARAAGCPADKFAGLQIHVSIGDKIKRGQKILTIYAESMPRLKEAFKFYESNNPVKMR